MTVQPAHMRHGARPAASAGPVTRAHGPFYLDAALAGAEAKEAQGVSFAVAGTLEELSALKRDWRALEEAHGRDIHFFQGFDWCHAWARTCLNGRCESPCVITMRRGGRLVLLWPLMVARRGPLRILRWLSDPYSQYGDVLTSLEGEALHAALEETCGFLMRTVRADLVRLRHVRDDANIANFLKSRFRQAGEDDGAPWLDLSRFADEEAYERRYSKTQRRRRKRIRKALEQDVGKLDFALLEDKGARGQAIGRVLAEKRAWLAAKGLYSRPLSNPALADFLKALPAGPDGGLVISQMTAAGRGVSWEIGFRCKGRHYGYITAHEQDLTDRSPGRLHMDLSQRRALKDGMRVFDLLVPVAPHKRSWSSGVMPVHDYYRPLSLAGRVFGEGYLRIGRPLLRKVYRKAPAALRRALGLGRFGGDGQEQA